MIRGGRIGNWGVSGAFSGRDWSLQSIRNTETLVPAHIHVGAWPFLDQYGEGQGGGYRPFIRRRNHTPLAYPWQHTWTRSKWMMRPHCRRRWRQQFVVCIHLRKVDTPTSAQSISNSGYGRRTPGRTWRPPHRLSAGYVWWKSSNTCGARGRSQRRWGV